MLMLISDIHLDLDSLSAVEEQFLHCISVCSDKKIKEIAILGDFFDRRKHQNSESLESAELLLRLFTNAGITVHIIVGNHDKLYDDNDYGYISPFGHMLGVNVYQEVGSFSRKNLNLIMLPFYKRDKYLDNLKKAKEYLNKDSKCINVLLTHADIDVPSKDSVYSKDFEGFDLILSGHHHDRRNVCTNPMIYYIGGMRQQGFCESTDKGGTILHDNGNIEFIKFPFREYVTINHVLNGEGLTEVTKQVLNLLSDTTSVLGVRVNLICKRNQLGKVRSQISTLESYGVEVIIDCEEKDVVFSAIGTEMHSVESLREDFIEFIADRGQDTFMGGELFDIYTSNG